MHVIVIGMQAAQLEQRFEEALTPEIYRGAWGFAARLCNTREDAEDLLQESLAKAFRNFGQLRDADKFKPWLFSIIRSLFLSSIRKKQLPAENCYWMQFVADAKFEHPLCDKLGRAMFTLPEQQRIVLSLFYLDGLNLNEVGQVLGVSQRVVAQRLHRARHALRRKLAGVPNLGVLTQG